LINESQLEYIKGYLVVVPDRRYPHDPHQTPSNMEIVSLGSDLIPEPDLRKREVENGFKILSWYMRG